MSLNTEQVLTLRQWLAASADPEVVAFLAASSPNVQAMAAWFDAPSAFVAWRSLVTEHAITSEVSSTGTTWSWPAYIARTQAERDGWARMFNGTYTINPGLANVRQGFADIFSGSANSAPAQRAHLSAICKRFASRGEAIFASGAGTTATPGTLGYEGDITEHDVARAIYNDDGTRAV